MAAALLSDADVGFGPAASGGPAAAATAGPKLLSDADVGFAPAAAAAQASAMPAPAGGDTFDPSAQPFSRDDQSPSDQGPAAGRILNAAADAYQATPAFFAKPAQDVLDKSGDAGRIVSGAGKVAGAAIGASSAGMAALSQAAVEVFGAKGGRDALALLSSIPTIGGEAMSPHPAAPVEAARPASPSLTVERNPPVLDSIDRGTANQGSAAPAPAPDFSATATDVMAAPDIGAAIDAAQKAVGTPAPAPAAYAPVTATQVAARDGVGIDVAYGRARDENAAGVAPGPTAEASDMGDLFAPAANDTPADNAGMPAATITASQVQARDGVGAVEAGRRAAEENAAATAPARPDVTVAPAPASMGAAAAREGGEAPTSVPVDEALAVRQQGEIERLAAPPVAGDTRVIIPDADPTLAEVTGNPRDATDQKYNRQQPEAMAAHVERENKVADAVTDYYADGAPSAPTLLRMDRERSARAEQNARAAFGEPDDLRPAADPTPVVTLMQGILDDPRMAERAVIQKTIPALMDRFFNDDGSMKTDPLALYGIREHIGDLLNGAGDPETSGAARQIKRQLMAVQGALDPVIEAAAPGFAKFRADYTADSRAIDAGKLLADARLTLLNKDQHITPAKWFGFMKGVIEGRADPMDPAASLSDAQMDRLWNITDQLKRSTFIDAGSPRGSPTSMLQEWGQRFGLVAAHAAVLPYAPGIGNVAIQMATRGLRARSVSREMSRVLNPDLGQGDIVADPAAAARRAAGGQAAPAAPIAPLPAPVAAEIAKVPAADNLSAGPDARRASGAGPGASVAYTPLKGTAVPVRYAVREARDIIPSQLPDMRDNPVYPAELQPRDRTRKASELQVNDIATNLNPARLGASASTAEGAPIVGRDGFVESGNARTLAIQQAYAAGSPRAYEYRQWVAAQGHDISGMKRPILVRERTSDLDMPARAGLARDMGANPIADMSASEQAVSDARAIPTDALALLRGGDVSLAKNGPFARAFAEHVLSPGERAGFMTSDGDLSVQGATRMRNALTQHAYGDNALVSALAEDADPDIKAFGGALMDAAGDMAKLRGAMDAGTVGRESDIAPDIVAAVRLIQTARRQRMSIADAVGQQDAFSTPPPQMETILRAAFGDNLAGRMSRKRMGEVLSEYAQKAQVQSGLFGANQSSGEMLAEARARYGYGTKNGTTGGIAGESIGDGPGLGFGRTQARGPGDDTPRQGDAGRNAGRDTGQAASETGAVTPGAGDRAPGLINSADAGGAGAYTPGILAAGPDATDVQKAAWRENAPRTADALIAASPANQARLAEVAERIAAEVGAPFKNPGIKKSGPLLAKIERGKSPNSINDAVRGGFEVTTPAAADAIVQRLAEHFQIADEGWSKTGSGYFDRTIMVRFPDGQVGEVQFWPPGMLAARGKAGGGHALYDEHRALPSDAPEREPLEAKMHKLYGGVADKLASEWDGLFGRVR